MMVLVNFQLVAVMVSVLVHIQLVLALVAVLVNFQLGAVSTTVLYMNDACSQYSFICLHNYTFIQAHSYTATLHTLFMHQFLFVLFINKTHFQYNSILFKYTEQDNCYYVTKMSTNNVVPTNPPYPVIKCEIASFGDLVDVKPDGNCFFRALWESNQHNVASKNNVDMNDLRLKIHKYTSKNWTHMVSRT